MTVLGVSWRGYFFSLKNKKLIHPSTLIGHVHIYTAGSKQLTIIADPVTSLDCEGGEITLTIDSEAFKEIHFLEKGVGTLFGINHLIKWSI